MTGTHGGYSEIDLEDKSIEEKVRADLDPTIASIRPPSVANEVGLKWSYGEPKDGEFFTGFPCGNQLETYKRNIDLFSRICRRMERVSIDKEEGYLENIYIPAGYTYFGQLIAHDIAHTASSRPLSSVSIDEIKNFREFPLQLNTIYGSGPEAMPWLYEPEPSVIADVPRRRLWFRIAHTVASVEDPRRTRNDLLRIDKCPLTLGACGPERFEPVVADARNEDNLILSQVTIMWKKFHNAVMKALIEDGFLVGAGDSLNRREKEKELFEICKKIVVYCYRNIIFKDYLRRIICEKMYEELSPSRIRDGDILSYFQEKGAQLEVSGTGGTKKYDFRLGAEFAMAVFRFGHAMVQDTYTINEHHTTRNGGTTARDLNNFLEFGREGSLVKIPLHQDWVMDPRKFFFRVLDKSEAAGKNFPEIQKEIFKRNEGIKHLNFSRRIRPSIAREMFASSKFALSKVVRDPLSSHIKGIEGGIPLRTLTRTYGKHMWTGQSLARKIGLAEDIVPKESIKEIFSDSEEISCEEKELLSESTPLFLYVLIEAELQEGGYKLGSVASRVIMDTFKRLDAMSPINIDGETRKKLDYVNKFVEGEIDSIEKMIEFTSKHTKGG